MIKVTAYNKETECKVNDGVAPDTILYAGSIEGIPADLVFGVIGFERLFKTVKKVKDADSVLITQTV